jgi:hypothetical protein
VETIQEVPNNSVAENLNSQFCISAYGIDPPNNELMNNFFAMVESKITVMTHKSICAAIYRNPQMKLSKADIDTLIPTSKSTSSSFHGYFLLCPEVENPILFLLLLRQVLLGFLNPFMSQEMIENLLTYYKGRYEQDILESFEK